MIQIDYKQADIICHMASVCYSEGIGPDYHCLIADIFKTFPDLESKYGYLTDTNSKAPLVL